MFELIEELIYMKYLTKFGQGVIVALTYRNI